MILCPCPFVNICPPDNFFGINGQSFIKLGMNIMPLEDIPPGSLKFPFISNTEMKAVQTFDVGAPLVPLQNAKLDGQLMITIEPLELDMCKFLWR